MPTPPVDYDYAIKSIGSAMTSSGVPSNLSTWGQVRTSVYYGGPYGGFFDNSRRHYEYIANLTGGPAFGMTAVESGNRLFRGAPWSCKGSNYIEYGDPYYDETSETTITPIENQWFKIGAIMDWYDMPLVLLDSSWVGAQTVTVESTAYDGTTTNGQLIADEPDLGEVTEINLVF